MTATARLAGIGGLAAQVLVEEGPDVGAGDVQGPGSGQAGAGVDTGLIGQQRQVGEGCVYRAGDQEPPLPAGHALPVTPPGARRTAQLAGDAWRLLAQA